MAVGKGKTRIIFTLSEKQAAWLQKVAKSRDISVSFLLRFFIRTSTSRFISILSNEDFELISTIAKTPWLDDDD